MPDSNQIDDIIHALLHAVRTGNKMGVLNCTQQISYLSRYAGCNPNATSIENLMHIILQQSTDLESIPSLVAIQESQDYDPNLQVVTNQKRAAELLNIYQNRT